MKRRMLMVSAMILLLGSQVQMYAQKKSGPEPQRPGVEMRMDFRPGGPMVKKAICQGDIVRLQEFYLKKYRVRLSRAEAERILMSDMRDRRYDDRKHDDRRPGGRPAPGPRR